MNGFFLQVCIMGVSFFGVTAEDCSTSITAYRSADCGAACARVCERDHKNKKARKEKCERDCATKAFLTKHLLKDKNQGISACKWNVAGMGLTGFNVIAPLKHGGLQFAAYSKIQCTGDMTFCPLQIGKCYSIAIVNMTRGCMPLATLLSVHSAKGFQVNLHKVLQCRESTFCYNSDGDVIGCRGGAVLGIASGSRRRKLYTGPAPKVSGARSVSVAVMPLALIGLALVALR